MNATDLQIVFRNHAGAWACSVTVEDATEETAKRSAEWILSDWGRTMGLVSYAIRTPVRVSVASI